MKTNIVNSLLVLSIFILLGFNQAVAQTDDEKSIVATFYGIDSDGKFEFIDKNKKVHLFDDVIDDLDIDLFDDDNMNLKFEIFWEEGKVEELNEEGEPTGKKVIYKTIIKIKEA